MVQIIRQNRFSQPSDPTKAPRARAQQLENQNTLRTQQLAQTLFGQTPLAEAAAGAAPPVQTQNIAGGTSLQNVAGVVPQQSLDPTQNAAFAEFAALNPGGAQAIVLAQRQAQTNKIAQEQERIREFSSIVNGSKMAISIANKAASPEIGKQDVLQFLGDRADELDRRGRSSADSRSTIDLINEKGLDAGLREMRQAIDLDKSFQNAIGSGKMIAGTFEPLEDGGVRFLVEGKGGGIRQERIGGTTESKTTKQATAQRKRVTDLRKEVNQLQPVKDARKSKQAFEKASKLFTQDESEINAFLKRATGQGRRNIEKFKGNLRAIGDMGLVFGLMKALDPTSTVREGEAATVKNTGGVSDQVRNLYAKTISGEILQDGQRLAILNQMQQLATGARDAAFDAIDPIRNQAKAGNLPFDQIFPDLELPELEQQTLLKGSFEASDAEISAVAKDLGISTEEARKRLSEGQ